MNIIRSRVSMLELHHAIQTISLERVPSGSGDTGWIDGLSMTRVRRNQYPPIARAVDELSSRIGHYTVVQIMVNKLHAGGALSKHRDGLPDNYRYHLPIVTTHGVTWWDEIEGERHMLPGHWYGPVPYCGVLHSMTNPTRLDRIHLVVDFQR